MPTGIATTGNVLNISGALFGVRDESTPLLSGMPVITSNAREFILGATYDIGTDYAQPEISETASLTAPDPTYVVRENTTNVVQPFHESVYTSYIAEADRGTLNGNDFKLANLSNNVQSELAWQIAQKNKQIRLKMENTVLNGTFQKATGDSVASKTRGLLSAITTHTLDAEGSEMNADVLGDFLQNAVDSGMPLTGVTLVVDSNVLRQITANWVKDSFTAALQSRDTAGFAIRNLITDFGIIPVAYHRMLPTGTALFANTSMLRSVVLPTPGKGNFFYEELGLKGAGTQGQIFGQWGLDYGQEFFHGKITNLAATTGGTVVS